MAKVVTGNTLTLQSAGKNMHIISASSDHSASIPDRVDIGRPLATITMIVTPDDDHHRHRNHLHHNIHHNHLHDNHNHAINHITHNHNHDNHNHKHHHHHHHHHHKYK